MSDPILPLAVWQSGTNENSIPANDNALRLEALSRLVISKSVTAQPSTPNDGDVYIIPAAATGAQWATFDEYDIAIYRDVEPLGTGAGTWYAWAPVTGVVVNIDGALEEFDAGWSAVGGGGGGDVVGDVNALSIASGVLNIDCSVGNYFTLALTANVTSITFSNLPAAGKAQSIAIRMRQDGTGSRTVALPSSFKSITGSDTAVQSAANAYTILHIETFDQGTRWEYSMRGAAA